jgi:raffinose/stachyose/melibiose transport system permease protein
VIIRVRRELSRVAAYAVLVVAALISLLPLVLVGLNTFKPHAEIVKNPLAPPAALDLSNFGAAWTSGKFAEGLVNSLLLSGSTIVITVSFAALAAYALARKKIRLWPLIALYFLVAITVPIQLFLFPLYFIFSSLGVVGNVFATSVILSALNLPLAIFLLRTYALSIPEDIDDAATIDGATPWTTFLYVIVPLMRPGLITVSIIVGLNAWNEFLVTSTFQQGEGNFTMTLGYLSMNGTFATDQGVMMAGAFIVVAPIIVFFLAMQRFFVAGLTSGAVKG